MTNFELGGFSIGYVIATSKQTDSQVSPSSPVGTISLSSCPVRHLWMTKLELGGFSIGYVIATSELTDSQVSSFNPGCNTTWKQALKIQKIKQVENATGESNKTTFYWFQKRDTWMQDYKLRRRFIGPDPFFKSGQPSSPLFSSPDKHLRPQLGLIKVRCLGQASFNFS